MYLVWDDQDSQGWSHLGFGGGKIEKKKIGGPKLKK
jgi:hypothetical protein